MKMSVLKFYMGLSRLQILKFSNCYIFTLTYHHIVTLPHFHINLIHRHHQNAHFIISSFQNLPGYCAHRISGGENVVDQQNMLI